MDFTLVRDVAFPQRFSTAKVVGWHLFQIAFEVSKDITGRQMKEHEQTCL